MHDQENGEPHGPRVPGFAEMLAGFPGPVAIPQQTLGGATPSVVMASNDDEPWAIGIEYHGPARHLLTVRTVRSQQDLDPRGLPVEDLAAAIIDFENQDAAARTARNEPPLRSPDSEAWVANHIAASRHTRAEVARTPTAPTSIVIDGAEIMGTRVDLRGCVGAQLSWGEQLVFCVGLPEIIDDLRLRSAVPEDISF